MTVGERGSAYWLLFEAAWWQGDADAENKNYTLYKEITAKNPDNKWLQFSLEVADRYRKSPNPKAISTTEIITSIDSLIQNGAYADGLHYAKYLLGRPDLPQEIRVTMAPSCRTLQSRG